MSAVQWSSGSDDVVEVSRADLLDWLALPESVRPRVEAVSGCLVLTGQGRLPYEGTPTWNGGLIGQTVAACGTDRCVRSSHQRFVWMTATEAERAARRRVLSLRAVTVEQPPPSSRPTPPPRRAPATLCSKGHPLDGENGYVVPGEGIRRCRTCQRERARERRARNPKPPRPPITHCPHGHEYVEENVFLDANGRRRCRTCRRERNRKADERRKVSAPRRVDLMSDEDRDWAERNSTPTRDPIMTQDWPVVRSDRPARRIA